MCACIQFYLCLKIYVCTHISFCSGVDITQTRQPWHMHSGFIIFSTLLCYLLILYIFSVSFFLHFIYMPAHRHTYGHLYITHMYTDLTYIYIPEAVYFCIAIMSH